VPAPGRRPVLRQPLVPALRLRRRVAFLIHSARSLWGKRRDPGHVIDLGGLPDEDVAVPVRRR